MSNEDLSKPVSIILPVGHLIIVWDILANKLAGAPANEMFTAEEKRAVWALQDLCEYLLIENGTTSRPAPEWSALIQRATEFVKTIPAEFLD